MTHARCTVGLLTWNGGEDAGRCVAALLAQDEPDLRIDWTDNASTDGTVARLQAEFAGLPAPAVNRHNTGFCAGHNAMLERCATRYYLALNQDVVLAPDYVRQLCDWLDAAPELALVSGLMLMPEALERPGVTPATARATFERELAAGTLEGVIVHSAGLVFPRLHYHFQLGMGRPLRADDLTRRRVPGVDGAAMVLRVDACRAVSLDPRAIFTETFFAYSEEIDLALRLARVGRGCGVEGAALAFHRGKGSGGFAHTAIRARFLANHWLLTLRHDPLGLIVRELPWIMRGELFFWAKEYAAHPAAFLRALGIALREAPAARRFYRAFERRLGPTRPALERHRRQSLAALRNELRAGG